MSNENSIKFGTAAYTAGIITGNSMSGGSTSTSIARVMDVIYVDSDKDRFVTYVPTKKRTDFDLGDVACYTFINNQDVKGIPIIAKPLNANITKYPVKDELIIISAHPTYKASTPTGNYEPQFYYNEIIGAWNAAEHNSVPQENSASNSPTVFNETGKVRKLIQGPGDMTFEGRSGNSIRFASAIPQLSGFPWNGPERSPLTIIRNGQKDTTGLDNIFEDINKDGSSIYMLNGHDVGFIAASTNFDSYKDRLKNTVLSNVIETKTPDKPIPAVSPAVSDVKPVVDTPPVTLPVVVEVKPNINDLVVQDENMLPDNDTTEYFQETLPIERASFGTSLLSSDFSSITHILSNAEKTIRYETIKKTKLWNDIAFVNAVKKLCSDYFIQNYEDLMRVMYNECRLDPTNSLYKNPNPADKQAPGFKGYQVNSSWKLVATGLIQWTTVNANTPSSGGHSLEQLKNMDAITQLSIVRNYFDGVGKSKLKNADKYAVYGCIFYPYMVNYGKISFPDSWVIGSQVSTEKAIIISGWNPDIAKAVGKPAKSPITVADFKKYVDQI